MEKTRRPCRSRVHCKSDHHLGRPGAFLAVPESLQIIFLIDCETGGGGVIETFFTLGFLKAPFLCIPHIVTHTQAQYE
jgi:hypothetical protein